MKKLIFKSKVKSQKSKFKSRRSITFFTFYFLLLTLGVSTADAQTTEFTYQGSMKSSGTPATGNFDFEFKLFDLASAGAQQGSTIQRLNVAVANGIFTVSLDFGAGTLPGADRFLDIAVRTASGGTFTPLSPRQKVNSAPYSVKSLNSTTADSVAAGGIPSGSGNYIQNSASQQASSEFNISGTGTANIFNATTQYNINGMRALALGVNNLYVGEAGVVTASGINNTFVGNGAGVSNTLGSNNTSLGFGANVLSNNLSFAAAIGSGSTVGTNNTIALGRSSGADSVLIPGILNVTGTSNANIFSATTQYNIGVQRVLSIPGAFNTFVGMNTGNSNTGGNNVFVGFSAGFANSSGSGNSFFGRNAGQNSTTGDNNSFFGDSAGSGNTAGSSNNSFFGNSAGSSNSASDNSFFGTLAGSNNFTGANNSFFGTSAGSTNGTGAGNTIIGALANVLSDNLTNASAIGSRAVVSQNNSLVLGSIAGINGAASDTNVGIGTTAPIANLHVTGTQPPSIIGSAISATPVLQVVGAKGGSGIGQGGDGSNVVIRAGDGGDSTVFSAGGTGGSITLQPGVAGAGFNLGLPGNVILSPTAVTRVGIGTTAPQQKLHVEGDEILSTGSAAGFKFRDRGSISSADDWVWYSNGNIARLFHAGDGDRLTITTTGVVAVGALGAAGATTLCRNASNQISTCSSSLRYKSNISGFSQGISFINQLRPISFDWKDGGMKDIGFGAEEIAKIDPRFVTFNSNGEVEGVKYDRLSVAFVNAFKEQQAQIEAQEKKITEQNEQINKLRSDFDALKAMFCSLDSAAIACKPQN